MPMTTINNGLAAPGGAGVSSAVDSSGAQGLAGRQARCPGEGLLPAAGVLEAGGAERAFPAAALGGRARDSRRRQVLPCRVPRLLLLAQVLLSGLLPLAAEDGKGQDPQEVIGQLDQGKTYRLVDEAPILGRAVADLLVENRWREQLNDFANFVLMKEAMEQQGVAVSDDEVTLEIENTTRKVAEKEGFDPRFFTLKQLAQHLKVDPAHLRELTRRTLGLQKALLKKGLIGAGLPLAHPSVTKAMQEFLEKMAKEAHVEANPKKLEKNEAVRISGRGYGREEVRQFILDGLGPLLRGDLASALELLTLEHLLHRELKKLGKEELVEEDKTFHLTYRARLKEYKEGLPNGRDAILQELQQNGVTPERYLQERPILLDVGITFLARQVVRQAQIKSEWERDPAAYQRRERFLAHIFKVVRDPEGRPYGPDWEAPGHERLNGFVAKMREERFADVKPQLERLGGLAQANFAETALKHSDDEGTRKSGGLIGRVGPGSVFPGLPLDAAVLKEALKLKPGETSGPLRSAYGWHLLKCLEKQETRFEEAQEQIYVVLLEQKRKEILERIQKSARIEDRF